MKLLNKKAIRNTAIFPMARKYTLDHTSKIIGISADDCIAFLTLRHYIQKNETGYNATAMGIQFGYCVNDKNNNAILTQKGFDKVSGAFKAWNESVLEGQKLIEKYGICV